MSTVAQRLREALDGCATINNGLPDQFDKTPVVSPSAAVHNRQVNQVRSLKSVMVDFNEIPGAVRTVEPEQQEEPEEKTPPLLNMLMSLQDESPDSFD